MPTNTELQQTCDEWRGRTKRLMMAAFDYLPELAAVCERITESPEAIHNLSESEAAAVRLAVVAMVAAGVHGHADGELQSKVAKLN